MKLFVICSIIMISVFKNFPQTANEYFPQNPGYTWKFNAVPLDSLNNPIASLAFVELDSFAVTSTYQGQPASFVVSKQGTESTINFIPFTDTSYYNMEGNNGWVYFKIQGLDSIVTLFDSTLAVTLLELLQSFQDWYSVYRFDQPVNSSYDIFSYDTTITFSGQSLLMRFKLEGKRFQDEQITTEIGDFNSKKFLLTSKVIYLFLGIIPITIVETADTNWIAPDHWIVKRFTPSTTVDLSFAGGGVISVPGVIYNITLPSPTDVADIGNGITTFQLNQNYPNPFNPETRISYNLPAGASNARTTLKIFDILGNEVAVLVDQNQAPGYYEVSFNAADLSSGVYYFRLNSGNFNQVRKMILVK